MAKKVIHETFLTWMILDIRYIGNALLILLIPIFIKQQISAIPISQSDYWYTSTAHTIYVYLVDYWTFIMSLDIKQFCDNVELLINMT